MAIKDSYTLKDLKDYALSEFPLEFGIIANETSYKFESRLVRPNRASFATKIEAVVLHFAYSGDSPVWVHSDGARVQYYHTRTGRPLFACEPNPHWMYTLQDPFSYTFVRKQPQRVSREEQKHAFDLAPKRCDLLVHLAFLITGQLVSISNPDKRDLLEDCKNLCKYLHNSKVARDGSGPIVSDQPEVGSEIWVTEVASTAPEVEVTGTVKRQASNGHGNEASSSLKRPLIIPNNMPVDITAKSSNKRFRISAPSPVTDPSVPPSQQLQSMFETLLAQCKSEVEVQWTTERTDSEVQIRDLKAELASEKERARTAETEGTEWKEKYHKLKGRVSQLMGDD